MNRKRDQREEMMLEIANRYSSTLGVGESQSSGSHSTIPSPSTSSPFFVPRSVPRGKIPIWLIVKTKEEEAENIVARFFLWSNIPFNITKNNPFYHFMFEDSLLLLVQDTRALLLMT
jgi:hypothetical protein